MHGKPTMNEVALEAGVSLGTVSKVLNGNVTVAEQLRERVLAACRKLNYQRNQIAASLRSRQTHTIGIIIPDILNTFYAALVEKLENLASSGGYTVIIVTTGENAERAHARIDLLRERQVDGMIVIPALDGSRNLESVVGSNMPCVIVDRVSADDSYPSVATDNVDAAYQGTKYLLSLGHRHIALAANSPRLWNTHERIAGFEQAMRDANAKADVRIVGMTVEEAQVSLASLFREAERPTALFTANNLVTLGAIRAQLECRLNIPGEMSLLAFDDFEWLKFLQPSVSAIQQPVDQIAVEAWRLMFGQLSKRPIATRHVRAGAQLMIRQSTVARAAAIRKVGSA
ncbi:LacI family DNA-binding transcriptional regulator [Labrys okinawensis]|uniref:LacI family DNA-binding transcriptional regulator n=1 Tax=Labrys okinawensis TaxID=346911 RepID=UPI0039BC3772